MIDETFKPIDGYSKYLINQIGQVYNHERQAFLQGSVNPDGYVNVRLTDDQGNTKTWGLHRLLGFVFIPYQGSIDDLVINHINGKKSDNRLENLEWVTYQGNAEHAGREGLTTKCIPILVRDAVTGQITEFPSFAECARHLGLTKDALSYRVKTKGQRVFPEKKQYMAKNCDESFAVKDIDEALLENGRSEKIIVKYLLNDSVVEYDTCAAFAAIHGVSGATVSAWLSKPDQPVLPGLIQLKRASDESKWRMVGDVYLELEKFTGKRCVVLWNDCDQVIYSSAIECAVENRLNATALNYRLKSNGEKVFKDGYRYSYYRDFIANNRSL